MGIVLPQTITVNVGSRASYYESLGYQVVLADLTGKLPMKEIMDKTHLLLSGWSEKENKRD